MNRSHFSPLVFAFALSLPGIAAADEQVRSVQSELKTQGFYYGEANGESTTETTAAIRRYQIRNGLEVTGTLGKETLDALGIGGATNAAPPLNPPPAPKAAPESPRSNDPVAKSDREFLQREAARRDGVPATPPASDGPAGVASPAPLDPPSAELPIFFAGTPYATAPRQVQEATLRRAQSALASRRFYRGVIDGEPGPATEEALLSYQRSSRLPLSGRLDLETLSSLRLLPGRSPVVLPGRTQRVYRGIIVR